MKTHIELDDDTLIQVLELGGFTSKKAAVNAALQDFLNTLRRRHLLSMPGQVVWEGDLDAMRASRVFSTGPDRDC
ncbi:MAG: type II toxin-antitoxin system VapB family antitoxin [Burkholderiaceae bacterium]|nr:type II toxin-antitoxin system VapB family antitoxin [Burkholderiaceae bacterium]